MHDCIILGSGRSGTSMVAGCLAKAGYYFGDDLIPAREANPKGFFESPFINLEINEAILSCSCKHKKIRQGRWWLSEFPLDIVVDSTYEIRKRIRRMVAKFPYCYKDPRFCYTLPIWRPFLRENTKFICVFRHPISTASSMIKECNTALYLKGFEFNYPKAYSLWGLMYEHILQRHKGKGDWLFIHYDQMFQKQKLDQLGEFLKIKIDTSFPEQKIRKEIPKTDFDVPGKIRSIYLNLCVLASYK